MKESKEEPNQVGEKAEPNLYGQLLAIRDCLIRDDKDEAYHILCTMADPDLSNENHWAAWELKSKLTPIEPLKEETKLQSEQKTAEDGFKEKLAIEILARFTGSSRGTPIAKQGFIDGALWAASQFKPSVVGESRIKELEATVDNLRNQIEYAAKATREYLVREKEEQRFTIEDMEECWQASRDHHFYQCDPAQKKYYPNFDEWIKTREL